MKIKKWSISDLKTSDLKDIYLNSVVYDTSLRIILESKLITITIIFEQFVSYRVNDESYLLKYWDILNESEDNGNIFYKIESSLYFKEMSFLSENFFTDGGEDMIEHYAFFTINDCIEVISDLVPIIKLTGNGSN